MKNDLTKSPPENQSILFNLLTFLRYASVFTTNRKVYNIVDPSLQASDQESSNLESLWLLSLSLESFSLKMFPSMSPWLVPRPFPIRQTLTKRTSTCLYINDISLFESLGI